MISLQLNKPFLHNWKINALSKKLTELQLKNEQISALIKNEVKPQSWVAWARDGMFGKTGVEKLVNAGNLYDQMKNEESLINNVSGECGIKAVDWVSNNPGKALAGDAGTYVLSKGLQRAFAFKDGKQSIPNIKFAAKITRFNLQEFGKNMRDL
jgi:hypothetical protein